MIFPRTWVHRHSGITKPDFWFRCSRQMYAVCLLSSYICLWRFEYYEINFIFKIWPLIRLLISTMLKNVLRCYSAVKIHVTNWSNTYHYLGICCSTCPRPKRYFGLCIQKDEQVEPCCSTTGVVHVRIRENLNIRTHGRPYFQFGVYYVFRWSFITDTIGISYSFNYNITFRLCSAQLSSGCRWILNAKSTTAYAYLFPTACY